MKNLPRTSENEIAREELMKIAENNGGYLKPEAVVQAASDPHSPIHDRFEWDDTEAARHYRNVQAGVLIRMIKITVVRKSVKTKQVEVTTTRAFQSLVSDRKNEEGSYQDIEEVMSVSEKREELLETVLKELAAYRKRYADLVELAEVWAAFDRVEGSN